MSQFRKYMVYIVLVLVSIVMLFLIFEAEKKMDFEIKKHHLRYTGAVQGASPLVSFTTVALGIPIYYVSFDNPRVWSP